MIMDKNDYKWLKVGDAPLILYGNKSIQAKVSVCGCNGCSYDKRQGARKCMLSQFCMGHLRPDRIPVVFVVA